ncbi:MAG: S1 RNA-binding domain-containing protein, partial [Planctomycetes bacterium]|nr:S1 RNA-binding domain-containing protein [Planctomycetota bacterium]
GTVTIGSADGEASERAIQMIKDLTREVKVGEIFTGKVVKTASFGAFVQIEPGVDGLIPISEMGWTRINRTSDVVTVGDVVDVVVIRVDSTKRRIALSMKQSQEDPWSVVHDSYEPSSVVKGRVTRLADFGAFVELAPGVEALIHISELSEARVRTCADVVQVGQEIDAKVLGVDQENRRISLSIKALTASSHDTTVTAEPEKKPKKRKKPLRGGLSSHFDW